MTTLTNDGTRFAPAPKPRKPGSVAPIKSSCILAWGYDHATRTLGVYFCSGHGYRYHDVPPHVAEGFGSPVVSKGKYFRRYIRGRFAFDRLPRLEHAQVA